MKSIIQAHVSLAKVPFLAAELKISHWLSHLILLHKFIAFVYQQAFKLFMIFNLELAQFALRDYPVAIFVTLSFESQRLVLDDVLDD